MPGAKTRSRSLSLTSRDQSDDPSMVVTCGDTYGEEFESERVFLPWRVV
jgi:hypothetical protein